MCFLLWKLFCPEDDKAFSYWKLCPWMKVFCSDSDVESVKYILWKYALRKPLWFYILAEGLQSNLGVSLKTPDGELNFHPQQKQDRFVKFYTALYTSSNSLIREMEEFRNQLPMLIINNIYQNIFNDPITSAEIINF